MDTTNGDAPTPSRAATARLQHGLRTELDTYRVRLAEDLVDVGLAEREGAHAAAIATLESHLAVLETLQQRVEGVVAGAIAEREAEAVIDAVAPARASHGAGSGDHRAAPEPVAEMGRGLVTAAALIALIVAGLLSLPTPGPDPRLAAVEASEEALAAAQSVRGVNAASFAELSSLSDSLHDAIGEIPPRVLAEPEVRRWLGLLLADQRTALLDLLDTMPEVGLLLDDLHRLSDALDLPLPIEPVRGFVIDAGESVDQVSTDPPGQASTDDGATTRPAPSGTGATPGDDPAGGPTQDRSETDEPSGEPVLPEPGPPGGERPEDEPAKPLDLPGAEGDLNADQLGGMPR